MVPTGITWPELEAIPTTTELSDAILILLVGTRDGKASWLALVMEKKL